MARSVYQRLILFGTMIVICLGLFVSHAQAQAAAPEAYDIINRVNAYRAELGLAPLTINARLMDASANQIDYLTATGLYTHDGWEGSRPSDRASAAGYSGGVSEVFVAGWRMTPAAGLTWWQNSAVHHRIITSSRYTQVGAAYGYAFNQHWYVMVVGIPSAAAPPPAPTAVPQPVLQQAAPVSDNANVADTAAEIIAPAPVQQAAPAAIVAPAPVVPVVVEEYSPPPIVVKPIVLSQPEADGSIWHTMAQGQAIWTLSAYYDVEVSVLLAINNLTENDLVMPGDRIVIRLADGNPMPTPRPTATRPPHHITRAGESLWTIAGQYGLTFAELLRLNGLDADKMIWPGDQIRVKLQPGEAYPPTPTPSPFHTTAVGESLWTIAAKYGLTFDELLKLNGLVEDKMIWPGDKVRVRLTQNETYPPTVTPRPTMTPIPVYRVQSGQFLYEIAKINGVALEDLMAWNNLTEESLIFPGDALLVVAPTVPAPTATVPPAHVDSSQTADQTPPAPSTTAALRFDLETEKTQPQATPPPTATHEQTRAAAQPLPLPADNLQPTAQSRIMQPPQLNTSSISGPSPFSAVGILLTVGVLLAGALTRLTTDFT